MTKTFYAVFDTKHFPTNPIVVTPAKMIQIMTEGQ